MRVPNFADPQFVDAVGLGGFDAAFNTVASGIISTASGQYGLPGLITPEAMTVAFSGMTVNIGLPLPWALVTSGGITTNAHGTLSNADTTNYSVNLASFVPTSGTVTAYVYATWMQIQNNPLPLPGPPPGHPNFNPNFIPSVFYATVTDSVFVSGTTTLPDSLNAFELFRTSLIPGQTSIATVSQQGQQRASPRKAFPPVSFLTGGNLTLPSAQSVIQPGVIALTHTLPKANTATGITYRLVNPLNSGNWTIAAAAGELIFGLESNPVNAFGIPVAGACSLWSNGISWFMVDVNPVMEASLSGNISAYGAEIPSYGVTGVGFLNIFGNGAYQDFVAAGTYTFINPISGLIRVRVLGGGAAGSIPFGGNGGGYTHGTFNVTQGTSLTVVVGSGGNTTGSPGGRTYVSGATFVIAATGGSASGSSVPGVGSGGSVNSSGGIGGGGGGGGAAGSQLGNGGNGAVGVTGGGGGVGGGNGDPGGGGGSAFGSGNGASGAINCVGATGMSTANPTNAIIRFPLDGYYGGGGDGGVGPPNNQGGQGGGGGGGGTSSAPGNGGFGGGGGAPGSSGGQGGNGGVGGGGGGGTSSAGRGGPGRVVIEW